MIAVLNKNDELAGILQNDGSKAAKYWADEVHEKLNDAYITLKFKTQGDHEDAEHIVHGNKVAIEDLDGDIQVFEIKTVDDYQDEKGARIKEVYAEHIALELNGRIIRPGTYNGYSAVQYLDMILSGTRWKTGIVEWFGFQDIDIDEYKSGIQAILMGASAFEGEFKFRVEMEHGRIKNLYVDLLERRGVDTGVQVLYGHNQKSLSRFEDSSEVYTALIGVAKGSEGGYLTFESVVAADKPAGQDWIGNEDALQKYGILMPNGERQHYMGVYTYGGTNENLTPEQLLTYTRSQLTSVSKPKYTYEAKVLDLEQISGYSHEKVRLGDTLSINNDDLKPEILLSARIVEYIWSKSDKTRNEVVLGDYRNIFDQNLASQIQSLRNTIISNAGAWENGGTAVIRSTVAPTDTSVVWVDTSTTPNVIKTFNEDTGTWDKATPTEVSEVGGLTEEEVKSIAQDETEAYAEKTWHVGTTAPADTSRKWLDTTESPYILKVFVDGAWQKATPTEASEVGADTAGSAATAEENAKKYAEPTMHVGNTAPVDTTRKWMDTSKEPNLIKAYINGAWVAAAPTAPSHVNAEANMHVGTTAPADTSRKWMDTSYTPAVLKAYVNGSWIKATPTTASEVGAPTVTQAQGYASTAETNAKNASETKMHVGTTAPTDTTKKWIDTSKTPNVMKYYNGTQWVTASPTAPEHVGAEISIHVGTTAPADTTRKWIDISKSPFILKTYQSGAWKAASPTDLADLTGKITETQITDGSIKTPHISVNGLDAGVMKTGVLDADLVQIVGASGNVTMDENGLKILNGAISIVGGLSDDQIASSSMWNKQGTYIDENGVYTGIVVAEQMEARVRSIVDNPTLNESLDGWRLTSSEGTMDLPTSSQMGGKGLRITTSGNAEARSDKFPVDPNKFYRIAWSAYSSALGDAAHNVYMGIDTYNNVGTETPRDIIDSISKAVLASQSLNTYFVYERWSGWKSYETYLVPYWAVDEDIPAGRGANVIRMSSDTTEAELRFLNYYNNGTSTEAWLYSPTISEASSGRFSFNQGQGGTLTLGGPNNGNGRLVVIDEEGNQIADLDAGTGGFQRLYVADFEAPNVAAYGGPDEILNFYVAGYASASQGVAEPDDNNGGTAWSMPLATIEEALRRIPKHWDGIASISIAYGHTIYEDIIVTGFAGGGEININGQSLGTTIVGSFTALKNKCNVKIENCTLNSTDTYSAISIWWTDAYVIGVKVNGIANYGTAYGVDVLHGAFCQIQNCEIYQCTNAICGRYGGTAFNLNNKGYAKSNALYTYGGYVVGGGTAPSGAALQANQYGGSIGGTYTHDAGSYVAPPPPETTKTVASTTGDNWSASYASWQGSGDGVKQGNWGYGRRTGLWFFGAGVLNTIGTGKTIKRMRLKITRSNNSGNSGSVNHYVVAHGYQTRPAGAPSVSGTVGNINLSWGQTGWVTISSSVYASFANGTYRGFGIYVASDSTSYYSRCEISATIEVTYA